MIPEGWSQTNIASITRSPVSYGVVQTGVAPNDGIPCVRVVDIASGRLDPILMIRTSRSISNSYRRTILEEGDLFMALRGVIGKSALATPALAGCNLTRGVARLAPKRTEVCSAYLFQVLNGPEFLKQVTRQANGSALQEISIDTLRKAQLSLPPLPEQRRIAAVLGAWDYAITAAEKLIAAKERQQDALRKRLLTGSLRLSGFEGEWNWVIFSDVFERVRQKNSIGNTNVLTISAQQGLVSQFKYFNKSVSSEDVRGYTLLEHGDFAYNKSYSDGYPMGALKPLENYDFGIVSSLYICFRLLNEHHSHAFLKHYFDAGVFNEEIAGIAQEGARNHGLLNVSVVEFFETGLFVPGHDEQNAIASVLDANARELIIERERLSLLRTQKRGLMQKLLTGQWRVPDSIDAFLPAEVSS